MKLNLGCGREYRPGWTNVDRDPLVAPDVVFDLESAPWPFPDDCADQILFKFVLEQLGQSADVFDKIMCELYRVAKPGAIVEIHSRYPLHRDFIDNPSCVRRITPDTLLFYDLAAGEAWRATQQKRTSLAHSLGVDFETVEALFFPDPAYAEQSKHDKPIAELARTNINVIQSSAIKLAVRKPFTPGQSLQRYGAICLERLRGMGDVVMALAAARALKQISGKPVYLLTTEPFVALARISPGLDGVLTDPAAVAALDLKYADRGGVLRADINAARYGLSRLHQIDAYLEHFGLIAPSAAKEIILNDPAAAAHARFAEALPPPEQGRKRVLVHPALGDPNRTWPQAYWRELCERLARDGHQVVLIGKSEPEEGRSVHQLEASGIVNAMDRLDVMETLALMRLSDILVSTDSGPIQLAGATSIHIVGLYSVVAGRNRLPFRQGVAGWRATALSPPCSYSPCYQWLHDTDFIRQQGIRNLIELYPLWCPNPVKYQCMSEGITVDAVYAAVSVAAGTPSAHQPKAANARGNGSGMEAGAP